MSNITSQLKLEMTGKQLRERRLRWQSRVVVLLVMPAAVYSCALDSWWRLHLFPHATATALLICTVFALLVWLLRAATMAAAISGGILTACIYYESLPRLAAHWASLSYQLTSWVGTGIAPLFTLFILTYAATKYRRVTKERLGIAEAKRGRNAAQVCANLGVAATGTWLILFLLAYLDASTTHVPPFIPLCRAAMLAALAESTADTISSEIGQVLGGTPRLITTLKPVAAGIDGAISFAGTAAGCCGAAVVVLVAMLAMKIDFRTAGIALGAAIFGLFFDSLLGATVERRGYLNNDAVNFLSTFAAAVGAGLLLTLFPYPGWSER